MHRQTEVTNHVLPLFVSFQRRFVIKKKSKKFYQNWARGKVLVKKKKKKVKYRDRKKVTSSNLSE